MTYELARSLKDAGFPYTEWHDETRMIKELFIPTLSELIEACGGWFRSLEWEYGNHWKASGVLDGTYPDEVLEYAWGDSPDEAIAKLYLALNKQEE